jgi:hypothetical protein
MSLPWPVRWANPDPARWMNISPPPIDSSCHPSAVTVLYVTTGNLVLPSTHYPLKCVLPFSYLAGTWNCAPLSIFSVTRSMPIHITITTHPVFLNPSQLSSHLERQESQTGACLSLPALAQLSINLYIMVISWLHPPPSTLHLEVFVKILYQNELLQLFSPFYKTGHVNLLLYQYCIKKSEYLTASQLALTVVLFVYTCILYNYMIIITVYHIFKKRQ